MKRVLVYYRILDMPNHDALKMANSANNILNQYGISVDVVSAIDLVKDPQAQQLKHVKIRKDCKLNDDLTPQEIQLYEYTRKYNNIKFDSRGVLACFITSTDPKGFGCTYRKPGKASVIITKEAPIHVLAHELGHVLGLTEHSNDPNNLMYGGATSQKNLTLNNNQITTIQKSFFLEV